MRRISRKIAGIGIVVLALALIGFVAACGDGDNGTHLPPTLRQRRPISSRPRPRLKPCSSPRNPDQGDALDEAVDDAEEDFEEGADAEHIVEIGQEIRDLLRQVE